MQKIINLLFTLTYCLTVGLILTLFLMGLNKAFGDDNSQALSVLRQTAVMVNGSSCSGSGSVIQGKSGKLYILTNSHVCNCAKYFGSIFVTYEGGETLRAKVIKQSWVADLCAAQIDENKPSLQLAPQLLPLTEVTTRGYPMGRLSESRGLVKGDTSWVWEVEIGELGVCPITSKKIYGMNGNLAGCSMPFRTTLTNLYSRPGSSGSPVVNNNGELVGVVASWHPDSEWLVPFNELRDFLKGL